MVILTSDNPRSEKPSDIVEDIANGIEGSPATVVVELDRAAAIKEAIQNARPNDTILITGKGHEATQVIGAETIPFDDRIVARRCIADLLATTAWKNKRVGA